MGGEAMRTQVYREIGFRVAAEEEVRRSAPERLHIKRGDSQKFGFTKRRPGSRSVLAAGIQQSHAMSIEESVKTKARAEEVDGGSGGTIIDVSSDRQIFATMRRASRAVGVALGIRSGAVPGRSMDPTAIGQPIAPGPGQETRSSSVVVGAIGRGTRVEVSAGASQLGRALLGFRAVTDNPARVRLR